MNTPATIAIRTLLTDPFFWIGQIGLGLIMIFGFALMSLSRGEKHGRPFYYLLSTYLVIGASSFVFALPFVDPWSTPLSNDEYLLRFFMGCLFVSGYIFYAKRSRRPFHSTAHAELSGRINKGIMIGVALMILVLGFIGFRLAFARANALQAEYVQITGNRYNVNPVIVRELTRLQTLHAKDEDEIKKLNAYRLEDKARYNDLQKSFYALTQQVKLLTLALDAQTKRSAKNSNRR